jgi:hypothetical protein
MVQKLENEKSNVDIQFARCTLKWFQENMNQGSGPQTWQPTAWDKNGATIITVHRAIAKRVEVWYRISFTSNDAVFEKRLEFPEGMDEDYEE